MAECKNCTKLQSIIDQMDDLLKNGPRMTDKLKASLNFMERRAVYLEGRAAIRSFDGKPASFDAQEIAVLRWAVRSLGAAAIQGTLDPEDIPDLDGIAIEKRLGAAQSPSPAS